MARNPTRDLDPLAALAEPIRRRLYEHVAERGAPVDRDQAAEGAGVSRALAAFHLDRLVDAGLLEVQFRRRTGRTGPGAGRPAKYYLRPEDREIAVSLPPRRYDLAAEILATAVEHRPDATESVLDAARHEGGRLVTDDAAAGPEALTDLLGAQGYEPQVEAGGVVRLGNCPFHALVEEHRELTCAMNLALLEGVLSRLGDPAWTATLDPRAGSCCVAFIPRA